MEGLKTSEAMEEIAKKLKIEVPIINAVNKIINDEECINEVISNLINRPLISES